MASVKMAIRFSARERQRRPHTTRKIVPQSAPARNSGPLRLSIDSSYCLASTHRWQPNLPSEPSKPLWPPQLLSTVLLCLRITTLISFLHSALYAPTSLSEQMTCGNGQIPCLSSNAWKRNWPCVNRSNQHDRNSGAWNPALT